MRPKSSSAKKPAEQVVKDIRRASPRHFSAEDEIRIVLEGLRGDDSIAELCRKEGIAQCLYCTWQPDGSGAEGQLAEPTSGQLGAVGLEVHHREQTVALRHALHQPLFGRSNGLGLVQQGHEFVVGSDNNPVIIPEQ